MEAVKQAAKGLVTGAKQAVAIVPANPKRPAHQQAIFDLLKNLRARFAERDEEIQGLIVAALAGEHCLLIGPPGTGKSALARGFAHGLAGANYFEWLLTKFTTPEELYGPVKMSALKQDRYTRNTVGKLPESHVAYLDEIFKANSGILNTLLAAVNERVFHDDGAPIQIPLITCIASSNELPDTPDLGALWDRFVIRRFVAYTKQDRSFEMMVLGSGVAELVGAISLDQWKQARADVDAVTVPKAIVQTLFQLRGTLAKQGIVVSDRRWVKAVQVLRAMAWLYGQDEVSSFHLTILNSVLWNTEDQIEKVRTEVMKIAGAEVLAAEKVIDQIQQLIAKLPNDGDANFIDRATSTREEVKRSLEKLKHLHDQAPDPASKTRIDAVSEKVKEEGRAITERIKKAVAVDF